MTVDLLHRGRFVTLQGATAHHLAANAWMLRIPRAAAVALLRSPVGPESFDEATFLVGGVETEQAVGSGEGPDHVDVSVLLPSDPPPAS